MLQMAETNWKAESLRNTLEFIQSMTSEMRDQAADENERFLAYLLEMAYVEASERLQALHQQQGCARQAA